MTAPDMDTAVPRTKEVNKEHASESPVLTTESSSCFLTRNEMACLKTALSLIVIRNRRLASKRKLYPTERGEATAVSRSKRLATSVLFGEETEHELTEGSSSLSSKDTPTESSAGTASSSQPKARSQYHHWKGQLDHFMRLIFQEQEKQKQKEESSSVTTVNDPYRLSLLAYILRLLVTWPDSAESESKGMSDNVDFSPAQQWIRAHLWLADDTSRSSYPVFQDLFTTKSPSSMTSSFARLILPVVLELLSPDQQQSPTAYCLGQAWNLLDTVLQHADGPCLRETVLPLLLLPEEASVMTSLTPASLACQYYELTRRPHPTTSAAAMLLSKVGWMQLLHQTVEQQESQLID